VRWQAELEAVGVACSTISEKSAVGGGSLPGESLPTTLLVIDAQPAEAIAEKLRQAEVPVITRILDDHVVLDPRTVLRYQEEQLLVELKRLTEE